jgi:hypothetical protein
MSWAIPRETIALQARSKVPVHLMRNLECWNITGVTGRAFRWWVSHPCQGDDHAARGGAWGETWFLVCKCCTLMLICGLDLFGQLFTVYLVRWKAWTRPATLLATCGWTGPTCPCTLSPRVSPPCTSQPTGGGNHVPVTCSTLAGVFTLGCIIREVWCPTALKVYDIFS